MEGNFVLIKWEKKYETGIKEIDEHHKFLFSLCNNLHEDLLRAKNDLGKEIRWDGTLSQALRDMIDYTNFHFGLEEKLMREANYKGYDTHVMHHKDFVNKLAELLKGFSSATIKTGFETVNFLRDWLLTHVAYDDGLYVPAVHAYLAAKGGKQAQA